LSDSLTVRFGKGFSVPHLKFCRQFYNTFPIGYAARSQFESGQNIIAQVMKNSRHPILQILRPELSWTHYRLLLKVENPDARNFYITEAIENNWGTRDLNRQISSFYYERLLSSQDKGLIRSEADRNKLGFHPQEIIKDPFILEFAGIENRINFLETELEQALIENLKEFLLELGKGFAFVARQKRISTETKDYFIDLVFYNFLLKCFVLIDLKTGELTHQDIGQLDMYVRYYEDRIKQESDNPTLGIILCTHKDETLIKYSILSENSRLFASKYKLYLPSEEELKREIEFNKQQFNIQQQLEK
jgi:predicted nuclease of restriction endonuclease-like (RecB) superfamily